MLGKISTAVVVRASLFTAAMVLPFLFLNAYVALSSTAGFVTERNDTLGFVASLLIGYIPIWLTDLPRKKKLLWSFIYFVPMFCAMFIFGIAAACGWRHACL